jgi:superfamily II DNA/RNA helicase
MNDQNNQALILLPTRELALQVMKALELFLGKENKIASALIIGGDNMNKQFAQLRAKPRLIVGTPGRINDHLRRRSINLAKINFLVLDEVDRMLDMGFGVQLDENCKISYISKTNSNVLSNIAKEHIEHCFKISE